MESEKSEIQSTDADVKYVGFWARLGASILDGILILLVTGPVLTLIYGVEYWDSVEFIVGFWDFVINWILPAVAVFMFWSWKQATPGKMAVKAVIVDAKTGHAPTRRQWITRYVGYMVSTIPLGLGYLWIAWDKRKQGWHDKLAGTVVVRSHTG